MANGGLSMEYTKEQEYISNCMRYKRYTKISSRISMIFMMLWGLSVAGALFMGLLMGGENYLFNALCLMGAGGFIIAGIYKKKNIFLIIGCLFSLLNCFFGIFALLFVPVVLAMTIANYFLNREYDYLSQQEGFPHFSIHLKEYDTENSVDKFEERKMEIIRRTGDSGGKMDEI